MKLLSCAWRLTIQGFNNGAGGFDSLKCQTFAASPAEPGELLFWFSILCHGRSEMSFWNSDSDQALEGVGRPVPSAPVASANFATFSPLDDSTMRSRSCSPEVR